MIKMLMLSISPSNNVHVHSDRQEMAFPSLLHSGVTFLTNIHSNVPDRNTGTGNLTLLDSIKRSIQTDIILCVFQLS